MRHKFPTLTKTAVLLFLFVFSFTFAQSPDLMSYQAIVRNSANTLVSNQAIGVRISILQTSVAGPEVYKEIFNPNPVTNSNGLLSLQIGSGTPITGTFAGIDWEQGPYFVKSEIDPSGGTSYSVVATSQLLSVPYALSAKKAQSVEGVGGNPTVLAKFTSASTLGDSQVTDDGTSVGVNTPVLDPNFKFQVNATSVKNAIHTTLFGTPSSSVTTPGGLYSESNTGLGIIGVSGGHNGVFGLAEGSFGGTVGANTGTGKGVWGVVTGAGIAGYFEGGTAGRGIVVPSGASGFGTESPTARLEVRQPTTSGGALDDNAAIYAYSHGKPASLKGAVLGTYNPSNYGTGIQGLGYNGVEFSTLNTSFATGNQDIGVYGSANTAGVEGTSTGGIGVVGYNQNSAFAATTGGGNSYGVYGYANTIGGVAAPAARYGVYGYATGATTNYAGYFSGNVQITGFLTKGSGTFKIDHPLDPENKYLYHSFVESPDMMNIYNGNVTTDASGTAIVELPSYFSALNKDFRYQLTVIGTFAQAIISNEIKDNTFVIKTDKPNVKVSWQVTGVRQDKYANAHRVVPEVEKEPEMRGKYLHAKEWGKPESQSMDSVTRPKEKADTPAMKNTGNESNIKENTAPKPAKNAVAGVEIIRK